MAIAQVDSATGLPNDWWPDGTGDLKISKTAFAI